MIFVDKGSFTYNGIELPFETTSMKNIKDSFGEADDTIQWNNYSLEHIYRKEGLSFTCQTADSIDKRVYWIYASTKNNWIVLENKFSIYRHSKLSDVVNNLKSRSWNFDTIYNELFIEYEYYDLKVEITKEDMIILTEMMRKDEKGLDLELFGNRRIEGIEIFIMD